MNKYFSWFLLLALIFQPSFLLAADKKEAAPVVPVVADEVTDENAVTDDVVGEDEAWTDEDLENWDLGDEQDAGDDTLEGEAADEADSMPEDEDVAPVAEPAKK